MIVVLTPSSCRSAGMGNTGELFDGEQLVSQAAIEALGVAVLPGATWCDVQLPDSELLNPFDSALLRCIRLRPLTFYTLLLPQSGCNQARPMQCPLGKRPPVIDRG